MSEIRPSWSRRLTRLSTLIAIAAAMNFGALKLIELTPGWPFQLGLNAELVISLVLAVIGVFVVLLMLARIAQQWFADRDALLAAGLSEIEADAVLRDAAGR